MLIPPRLDAALAGDVLGNASGILMLTLAVSVVAAIVFVPLRPRAESGPFDRLLTDIAVLLASGLALTYVGLLVLKPQPSMASVVVYAALVMVEAGWIYGAIRAPSRGLLLVGVLLNVGALPFAVSQMVAVGGADVLSVAILHGLTVVLCLSLLWPPSRERLAKRLASADLVAGGRAATIGAVALIVLLGLAGPGHGHEG